MVQYTSSNVCTLNFMYACFVYFMAIPTILNICTEKNGDRFNLSVADTKT